MAKRKNPLKDLDAFLQQEASSFVKPPQVTPEPDKGSLTSEIPPQAPQPRQVSKQQLIEDFYELAKKNETHFEADLYEIIETVLTQTGTKSSRSKMLINTVLYLNNQDNWRESITAYWADSNK